MLGDGPRLKGAGYALFGEAHLDRAVVQPVGRWLVAGVALSWAFGRVDGPAGVRLAGMTMPEAMRWSGQTIHPRSTGKPLLHFVRCWTTSSR